MADSQALKDLRSGMKAVDNVLSFAKGGVGKPSAQERSLFVASVALSYAVWENYVEEVAIEATRFVARHCDASAVPHEVRDWIVNKSNPKPDAWDLAVHPGWRELWIRMVQARAKGEAASERDFGLLSADPKNVSNLFSRVGVDPFAGIAQDDLTKLDKLVEQRGQIVHTGKAPPKFYKQDAVDWRKFVQQLADDVDQAVARGVQTLTGGSPW